MHIGFIGTGNMGGAILKGYVHASKERDLKILVHNRSAQNNDKAKAIDIEGSKLELKVSKDNRELTKQSDIVILGVKPNGVPDVLSEIATELDEDKIIVSMAAGLSIAKMETYLNQAKAGFGDKAKLVRVMPNTPAQVGKAMTSVSKNGNVSEGDLVKVIEIFSAIGEAREVDEDLIHCVIGVSGSSTAYTFMYIDALVQAAIDNGMDADSARRFAAQSVLGAAEMALRSEESLGQLTKNVCSPNGTTIEAVNTLKANGFMDNVKEAFQAAVDRSKEMTKED